MRLGIIGAGGMAATLLDALTTHLPAPLQACTILVRPGREAPAQALLDKAGARLATLRLVETSLGALLTAGADLVVECAGHGAVREHGVAVLAAGGDLAIASTGALADAALHAALLDAADAGRAKLILPAGAVGGLDALDATRLLGTPAVTYVGRKPPGAWRGTKAEALLDLAALTAPAIFYEGSARDAARDFPQNANVAATVALAGIGFEATRVQLVADPTIARNLHEVSVESDALRFSIRLEGVPSPANPKTSLTAGLSLARAVLNRAGRVEI
jgi:aspartate dehydrogenase